MLRYLTPRWPYNIQGPQTLAVAQISLTNYKQWDWGVVGTTHHQSCPLPRHWPPPLQSEPAETDTPSSFGSWLVLFLQAIVIHIYKEHFQEWKFSGGSARMFFKSKVALGVWIFFPFLLVYPFFLSFLTFFFFFETLLSLLCLFPRILKETWYGRLPFNLYDVSLSWKGKRTQLHSAIVNVRVKRKVTWSEENWLKELIDEKKKSKFALGMGRPFIWEMCSGVLVEDIEK